MRTSSRIRRADLDLKAQICFMTTSDTAPIVYDTVVCDLTDHGAMIQVDLPCDDRMRLFEKIRFCVLQFEDSTQLPEKVLAKAVWFQPQTSTGDMMTIKVGLSFQALKETTIQGIRKYLVQGSRHVSAAPGHTAASHAQPAI